MRNLIFVAAAFAGLAVSADASAQSVSLNRPQISNDSARKMVDACLAYASRNNAILGVAVVGIDGVLLDFHLMTGGGPTFAETAILKAKTAVHWRQATKDLEQDVKTGDNGASVWIGDFPRTGGFPIVIDGQVAGGIGIGGGGMGDQCAEAAMAAVNLNARAAQR